MDLAWDLGFKRVNLESDSFTLVFNSQKHKALNDFCGLLWRKAFTSLEKEWKIEIVHVKRTNNLCANWLAKKSISVELGSSFLTQLLWSCPGC